jgi:hypothetical protein
MLRVQGDNLNEELIAFIHSWFDLLAKGRLEEACEMLDRPNSYGIRWTGEKIQSVVEDNFGPGTVFASTHPEGPIFTSVAETSGESRADVLRFNDGSGFSVKHDLPLNGEWSDMTAQFEFLGKAQDFEVVLHDLHVM